MSQISSASHELSKEDVERLVEDASTSNVPLPEELHVNFGSIAVLAKALQTSPGLLADVTRLRINSPDDAYLETEETEGGDKETGQPDPEETIWREPLDLWILGCQSLASVLTSIATTGGLKSLIWKWEDGGYLYEPQPSVPDELWSSLKANAKSLEELDLSFSTDQHESFAAFPSTLFANLRHLNLYLANAHGWDATTLHTMLLALPRLTSLSMTLPTCCATENVSLAGSYPCLKAFTYNGIVPPVIVRRGDLPSNEFLKRHPTIEYLALDADTPHVPHIVRFDEPLDDELTANTDEDGAPTNGNTSSISDFVDVMWVLDGSDLPNLKALSIKSSSRPYFHDLLLENTCARPLTALESVSFPDVAVLETYSATLKCLHSSFSSVEDGPNGSVFDRADIPVALSGLVELKLSFSCQVTEKDLVKALQWIKDMPSLQAFSIAQTIAYDKPPPERPDAVLANLPCVPVNLLYLGWTTDQPNIMPSKLYRIVREEGRIYAAETGPAREPTSGTRWIDSTVLDHFGAAASDWYPFVRAFV